MSRKIQKSYYDKHIRDGRLSGRRSRFRRFLREFLRWMLLVFVAVILGYAVVTFGFQTVTVVGPSMSPTLEDAQVVLVNKMVYRVSDIRRYDVVAFNEVDDEDGYYDIKRVIGLPGETIRISNGDVYINGNRLTDLPFASTIQISGIAEEEITLAEDTYFVIGDNVNNSEDSRYTNVGNISKTEIIGRVDYRLSPKRARGKINE